MDKEYTNVILAAILISKFNGYSMDFLKWLNSFEYVLDILRAKDKEKGKYLLNMVESSVFKQIQENVSPTDPFDLTYNELLSVLVEMYAVVQGEIVANYRFLTREQLPREPIEHYILTLRELFTKCTPFIKNTVDIKLHFINGLENRETKALLKKQSKDITFAAAIATAKQRELANQELKINFY